MLFSDNVNLLIERKEMLWTRHKFTWWDHGGVYFVELTFMYCSSKSTVESCVTGKGQGRTLSEAMRILELYMSIGCEVA